MARREDGYRKLERGNCLMIGGEEEVVERLDPNFRYDAPSCGAAPSPSRSRSASRCSEAVRGRAERFDERASALGFGASRVEGEGFAHVVYRPRGRGRTEAASFTSISTATARPGNAAGPPPTPRRASHSCSA